MAPKLLKMPSFLFHILARGSRETLDFLSLNYIISHRKAKGDEVQAEPFEKLNHSHEFIFSIGKNMITTAQKEAIVLKMQITTCPCMDDA